MMIAPHPCRIAVVNTHPIQYFAPLYAYLNRAPDLAVTALYLSDFSLRGATDRDFGHAVNWDVDLMAGYSAKFVGHNARRIEPYGFLSVIAPRLLLEISRTRYDAVWIHGHGYAGMLQAMLAARLRGIPVLMRGETHLGLHVGSVKRVLRPTAMRALYRQCAGLLAIGSANRDFYRAMAVPTERISLVPYTVDNDRFAAMSRITADERTAERARLGVVDDAPIILFASKFQKRKRAGDLLQAFLKLRRERIDAHLVLVGSGEAAGALKAAAADDVNVHFPGFINQAELPRVFASSEVFVLPSDNEPWGLIVNEVMCAGLPVVVSAEVGCVRDLVRDGENGATFPAGDIAALAAALKPIVTSPSRRHAMGEASRRIIANWSYRECLKGLREALAKAGIAGSTSSSR